MHLIESLRYKISGFLPDKIHPSPPSFLNPRSTVPSSPDIATLASTTISNSLAVARAHLESFKSLLPSQVQYLLPQKPPSPPTFLTRQLDNLKITSNPYPYILAILVAVVLPLSMASWRNYLGGRYSPFASQTSRPQVTEEDYHYLGPEDIVDPPSSYFNTRHVGSRAAAEDPRAPDILILKHRGTTYPLHFPAFSIGEGVLRVGELRRYAAQETGTSDPRRVKLLYKGKVLKDDAVACREEGLKQNSELMCVVETPMDRGDSSESADEDEIAREDSRGGPRVDVDGTLIGAVPKKRGKASRGKKPKKGGREDEYPDQKHGTYSGPSAAPPMHFNAAGAVPPPPRPTSAQPPPNANAPKGPMEKLDEVAGVFHDKFVPLCLAFMKDPPREKKVKYTEYMKLSESILAQIIFKLDGVETEGNEEARAKRKALVKETQAMLARLDEVGKV